MTEPVIKERVVAYWSERAASFDDSASHVLHAEGWAEVLTAATAELARPARVLDLGAGTGACSLPIARQGHAVTAVDIAEPMLAGLRRQAEDEGLAIETVCADVDRLELAPAAFDLVMMRNLLWTLPDPAGLLARVGTTLRPGGLVLIADGYWDHLVAAPDSGHRDGIAAYPHPGADQFLAYYQPIADQLPLYRGVSSAAILDLVRGQGFVELRQWQDRFAQAPYPTFTDFFVLTARRPAISV